MQAWVDHLIIAGPSLEAAVDHVRTTLGIDASPGGAHPGVGTRNALARLGPGVYLEIIGPDPEQPTPELPRWFGIDELRAPRLVTWSARTDDLEGARSAMLGAGVDPGPISGGGRRRPDGVHLTWRATDPRADRLGGVVPFLMDWGESEHPSDALSGGLELLGVRLYHPRPEAVRAVTAALSLPVDVVGRGVPGLESDVRAPHGVVTLR
jgi:hypothetical protein